MDAKSYEKIVELTRQRSEWVPQDIPIGTCDGDQVNLMDYIGEGPLKRGTTFFLPVVAPQSDICGHEKTNRENRKKVVQYVFDACAHSGFPIVNESWDLRDKRINIVCDRGILHDPSKSKGIRKTSTHRPTRKEDLCPFRFNIHWFEEKQLWGIKAGLGVRCHKGHMCLDKENVKVLGTRALPPQALEFCMDALRSDATPGMIKAYAKQNHNVTLSSSKIEYWQRLVNPKRGEHTSAASSLIQSLKDAGDISFVALYDDPSSSLLRVKKPSRGEQTRLQSALYSSRETEPTLVSERNLQENTNAMKYVCPVRDSMCLDDGQLMLLALIWNQDKEYRLGCLNPDVFAVDVTEQTNSEKRPFIMFAGITGNNETFSLCRGFLPSQQRWVFDWFFGTAVPFLIPSVVLNRNRMMLTDGDEKEYNSFLASLDEHYPNSCHHLCTWHLLDRGLRRSAIMGLCSHENMCNDGVVAFKAIKLWIQSWFTTLETEMEYKHSFKKLHEWLSTEEVITCMGANVVSRIVEFIRSSITPHKNKWLYAYFLKRRTYDRQSSQLVEVENSVLKRASNGPKPFHAIDTAARKMILLQDMRISEKCQKAANAMNKRNTRATPNDIDTSLTNYCVEQVLLQSNAGYDYDVYRQNDSVFFVKRKPDSALTSPELEAYKLDVGRGRQSTETNHRNALYFVPKYERTRVVSIVVKEDKQFLQCSCGKFERHGFPCRHIYAVLKRKPMPYDVIARFHKSYESHYLVDQKYTEHYDALLSNEMPGPPVEQSDLLQTEIDESIPTAVIDSLPNHELLLSRACKWGRLEETAADGRAQVRLQEEFSLSQTASRFADDANSVDNVFDFCDGADSVLENDKCPALGSPDDSNIDPSTSEDIVSVSEDDLLQGHLDAQMSSVAPRGGNFHQDYGPVFQEYCKMSEWGPKYSTMLGGIMMKGLELTRRAYLRDQKSKRPHDITNAHSVVSSHLEARGPKKAKRLKPIGSPSR